MLKEINCSVCGAISQKTQKEINKALKLRGTYRCKKCYSESRRKAFVGQKFGRMLVVEDLGAINQKTMVRCVCDCGTIKTVSANSLGRSVKSCGCLAIEAKKSNTKTHGLSSSRTYRIWMAMKARCKYPNYSSYPRYGGRGISVCERWMSFELFLQDMGEAPDGYQIDRVDNNGNYDPSNCKWSSRKEQARNKSTNRWIEFLGEKKCLKDWADMLGMDQASLAERIEKWGLEKALTTPKGR